MPRKVGCLNGLAENLAVARVLFWTTPITTLKKQLFLRDEEAPTTGTTQLARAPRIYLAISKVNYLLLIQHQY